MPLATTSLAYLLRIGHDPARIRELAESIDGDAVTLDTGSAEWRAEARGALDRFKVTIEPSEQKSAPASQPRGMSGAGDLLAKAIETVTFGKVKPCSGCQKRKEAMNRAIPFRR